VNTAMNRTFDGIFHDWASVFGNRGQPAFHPDDGSNRVIPTFRAKFYRLAKKSTWPRAQGPTAHQGRANRPR
jgi:hypothetical protein